MAALNVQWEEEERPDSPQHLWFPIRACSFFWHCAEPRKRSRETDLFVSHFVFTCCGSEAAARSGAGRLAPVCLQYLFTSVKTEFCENGDKEAVSQLPFASFLLSLLLRLLVPVALPSPRANSGADMHINRCAGKVAPLHRSHALQAHLMLV